MGYIAQGLIFAGATPSSLTFRVSSPFKLASTHQALRWRRGIEVRLSKLLVPSFVRMTLDFSQGGHRESEELGL